MTTHSIADADHHPYRRWTIFAVVMVVLLLIGFYTVTDPERLHAHSALEGADYVGYAFCHRITDRSFTIAGRQLPLCARCTGMYLGAITVFAVLLLSGRWRWSELPPFKILIILIGFVGIMGIDGVNSYSHFFPNFPHVYEPQNWLRLTTGMGTGLAMGALVFPALSQTLWREQVRRAPIGTFGELAGLVLVSALLVLLVLSNQPTLLYVLGLASAIGLLALIISLNTMMLLIITRRDAQAMSWRQVAAPLLIGTTLAIIEIATIAIVRFNVTGTLTGIPGL